MVQAELRVNLQHHPIQSLLSRRSAWPLDEPAPPEEILNLAFDAALCAPDHGQLRPWRFAVIRGAARVQLGEIFAMAARRRDPEANVERFRAKAMAAPVLIALGVRIVPGHKVPEAEQTMAVAAGAMNLLNALHMLGYGGFWASGKNTYDAHVRCALGFDAEDRLAGFVYAGTPRNPSGPANRPSRPSRPSRALHVRHWHGPIA